MTGDFVNVLSLAATIDGEMGGACLEPVLLDERYIDLLTLTGANSKSINRGQKPK
jgi:hypothetical protein